MRPDDLHTWIIPPPSLETFVTLGSAASQRQAKLGKPDSSEDAAYASHMGPTQSGEGTGSPSLPQYVYGNDN